MQFRILPAFVLSVAISCSHGYAQKEDLSVLNYWNYYNGQPAALYHHLSQTAFSQLEERQSAVSKLKTLADWKTRQATVRKKLQETVGAFPPKTPLNPVITGTVKRDGVVAENLYFESLPGYYVTAALFKPENSTGSLPAIIFCSGHSENGYRSETYQHIILNYVKKGFAVLAFDPVGQGERIQYFKADGTNRFGPTHEHSYPGSQTFLAGISPARYFIWDGIRAVDYLLTRDDIDPVRIGITGRSGGGTQSAYIAAFDERILAAAPENYLTTFDKLLKSNGPQDAEQNLYHVLAQGLDQGDFVQVRAPKPLLMVTTTRDIFSIQGARDLFKESMNAYSAYGKKDHLMMVEDDAGHASTLKNREASYAFFQKYLNNPGSSKDEDTRKFTDQELYVTSTGNVYNSIKGENLFSVSRQFSENVIAQRKNQSLTLTTLAPVVKKVTGYQTPPRQKEAFVFSGRIHRAGYAIEKYLVAGPGKYYLPVLWLKPEKITGKPVLIYNENGKSAAAEPDALADLLVKKGHEVILADLSGAGELSDGYMKGGDAEIDGTSLNLWFAGILINKSLVGIRMEEMELVSGFIKQQTGAESGLQAIATGTFGADLLHAAVANPQHFTQIALLNPLVSYQSIAGKENYHTRFIPSAVPGALAHYDLPDLVHALSVKNILMINPVDAEGKITGSVSDKNSVIKKVIDWVK